MRRGVAADTVASVRVDRLKVGTGRTLAVRPANDDQRTALHLAEFGLDTINTLQPQFDAALPLGMKALEVHQPFGQ